MAKRIKVRKFEVNTPSRCATFVKNNPKLANLRSAQMRRDRALEEIRSKSVKEVLSKDIERHLPGLRYLADR